MKKLLALLLAACMLTSITAAFAEEATGTPLVVAISALSAKFSPFFADTGYDQDVVELTQIGMMTTDRVGGFVYNAIEGETVSYNGTVYLYTSTETTVKIFTILGQQITAKKLSPGVWSYKLNARGIYILKAGPLTKRLSV